MLPWTGAHGTSARQAKNQHEKGRRGAKTLKGILIVGPASGDEITGISVYVLGKAPTPCAWNIDHITHIDQCSVNVIVLIRLQYGD
jgi:hypothetical protein